MFRPVPVLLTLFGGALAAIGPVTDLVIKNAFAQPDGFNRSFVTAGGTLPGPIITGFKGDTFQINLQNQLNNGTMLESVSIHWHGIFQEHSNWADGSSFVNQCPIAANNSFLYEFNVPDQAGTFWYHSHLATQYCDQLTGALIVYDPDDPLADLYDVDDDGTVIVLSLLYHDTAPSMVTGSTTPNATLINGLGRSWFSTEPTPLSVITVTQGLRYRMRVIHSGCDNPMNVSIDFHPMLVIEADGIEHDPVPADGFQILVAQRYSFVLTANQSIDNYWIKVNDVAGAAKQFFDGGINSAILRYVGAPDAEPTVNQTVPGRQLLETDLHPLIDPTPPGGPSIDDVDVAMNLELFWEVGTPELGNFFFINGVQFHPPSVPVLLQIVSGAQPANALLPTGSVYELPLNSSIQLTFNTSFVFQHGGPHPFHLHGQKFSVIRSAGSSVDNFVNPAQRDVVDTGMPGDNVTIRFFTANAGPWFLHCHIDFHLEAGFAIVFAQGTDAQESASNPTPADWDELCPIYDSLTPAQLGGDGGLTE
ncbi:laccase [Gymnopus androsaceus JB14]|uniref:laccase n=1 Tax=Gymnopus androsaceus JB14 TaxID=1447944 RepID=A0A6A4HZF3_9AGAR|nr:laccase [Gymnopus androsaceus JB14]